MIDCTAVPADRVIAAAAEHPDASIATANAEKILKWTNPKLYGQTKQTVDVNVKAHVQVDQRVAVAIGALSPAQLSALTGRMLTAAPTVQTSLLEVVEAAVPTEQEDEP